MPFIKALDHAIPNGQTFNNLSKAPGAVAGGLTSAVGSVGNVVGVDQVKGAAVHVRNQQSQQNPNAYIDVIWYCRCLIRMHHQR